MSTHTSHQSFIGWMASLVTWPLRNPSLVIYYLILPIAMLWGLNLFHEFGHCFGNWLSGGSDLASCTSGIQIKQTFFFIRQAMFVDMGTVGIWPIAIIFGPLFGIIGGVLIARQFRYDRLIRQRNGWEKWRKYKVLGFVALLAAGGDVVYGFLPWGLMIFNGGGDGRFLFRWVENNWMFPWPQQVEVTILGIDMTASLNPLYGVFLLLGLFVLWEAYQYVRCAPLMCDTCRVDY